MWDVGLPPSALCVLLAILSGTFNTLSTLAITYPTREAARRREPLSHSTEVCMYITNFSLVGVSNVIGILANGQGPVAVTLPFMVASNILSILLGQWRLGMIRPSKPVRVGTFTLVAAVMILPDIGPADLPADSDIKALLQEPSSIIFIGLCVLGSVLGYVAVRMKWIKDNGKLVLTYALLGGAGTVLNTSISKLVQLNLGSAFKVALVVLYVLFSCFCLCIQAVANATLQDPSLFVPVGAGVNLVLNFFAGLCIWDDGSRLRYPLGYCMLYVLVVLGTYSVSSFDLFEIMNEEEPSRTNGAQPETKKPPIKRLQTLAQFTRAATRLGGTLTKHVNFERDSFFVAGVHLRKLWDDGCDSAPDTSRALRKFLKRGCARKLIDSNQLIDLIVELVQEPACREGTLYTEGMEAWMDANVDTFNECSASLYKPLFGASSDNLTRNFSLP
eukprot:TRINITY_DN13252_c0_g2_i1.p1 TRINITY_DN13252_c0_g2~~TRINITY_DN13252_c0_g2_i1.p1  ORF type:complete len:445 (-),score=86.87 TRINITY_DN13252_c0_g2_i1:101-1435(-)